MHNALVYRCDFKVVQAKPYNQIDTILHILKCSAGYLNDYYVPTITCCTTVKKAREKEKYFESLHFSLKRQDLTTTFISLFGFPP